MSQYIVSARKYRPDSFGTLIGQDNIAQTLKNSILRGQLAHAYLFCGPRGVGKTTTARIFAKMINCSNPSEGMEPCGTCESCLSFAEGRSYCIHELDAASNNGVDDIKALMDQVRVPPQVGKYSVYIIDEVHMLSQSAFNAFLKTLEEPPAHAIFILATTEKHKILPTILSRCQTYDFNRITVDNIVRNLRMVASNEGISIDDESLHVIAHKADGAMRDALTIFDQTVAFCGTDVKYQDVLRNLNVLDYEYSFSLVEAFLRGDYPSALTTFDEILTKGFNALHFVAALSSHLRDLAVSKTGGLDSLLELPDSLKKRYKEQAERCPMQFIYEALGITTACESGYRASVNPRLHIEFALMRLAFLMKKPEAQTVAPVSAAPQTSVTSVAAPAEVQQGPVSAVPAQQDESPSAQQRERRTRGTRTTAGLSMKAILSDEKPKEANVSKEAPAPSEEEIREKWPELALRYKHLDRLCSMLNTTTLSISDTGDFKTVVFRVVNEAQKTWVETKMLHDLEGNLRAIMKSMKIYLRVEVTPDDEPQEKKIYMPGEQAGVLMKENSEVNSLITDLGLDIK
ncbi:MAG: DNA polymerase III subunit gamma/tau [Bacteroidales bacterium]|nr:DNA polymerase III subunit gamma/tau [Bacteroidales bacterium]